jgi:replicative superfamily II helicase
MEHPVYPGVLAVPEHFQRHLRTVTDDDLMRLLATAASPDPSSFELREWQRYAIPRALVDLENPNTPVLVNAAVGTGKTLVAGAAILKKAYDNTGYMSKVLLASPLVDLAREQYVLFAAWAERLNPGLSARRALHVALRAGSHNIGDVRRAQLIIATYEYARIMLADAEASIYPGAKTRDRSWAKAWSAVIVDEAHMIMGSRGPVVRSILAMAKMHRIPVMLMTGTVHDAIRNTFTGRVSDQIDKIKYWPTIANTFTGTVSDLVDKIKYWATIGRNTG